MSAVLNYCPSFEPITCCVCGIVFAVPAHYRATLLSKKQTFYCPTGHPQSYTESSVDRVRREMQGQIDAEKRRIEFLNRLVQMEREATTIAKKALTKTRTALTKTKNRIANGVCPVCRRSFKGMHEHMVKQHPEFTKGAEDTDANRP